MNHSSDIDELSAKAPIYPRGVWRREGNFIYLCGTLGAEFDTWQRARAAVSAAEAYFSQQIGLNAIEAEMDRLENEARGKIAADEILLPRRSPGYGDMPLDFSREIIAKLDATRRIGVSITESNLLVPSKSVTAVCVVETGGTRSVASLGVETGGTRSVASLGVETGGTRSVASADGTEPVPPEKSNCRI